MIYKTKNKRYLIYSVLLAILIAAFAVRIYKIDTIPYSIYPDEAMNGVDAQQANATGNYKWFYESNNGREGLFINLQAMSIKYIGNSIVGLKIWSIIFGTLTVLGLFFLAAELFQSHSAGLVGAYLIAFSYWAINFSRIGFRAIMLPFLLTWAFYFLFKGLRTKRVHDFIIAGFIYGLGLHTYIAFRASPLILIVLLISLIITRREFLKQYWRHVLVFAVTMFIAAAPMLLDFFYFHPEHYTSRTSEISVLNPEVNQGHLLTTLAKTIGLSLAKYNFWGDQNMRQNYPPYPILNPITGIAFLIGFIYCIIEFFRLGFLRIKFGRRNEKFDLYVFLLAWFFVLLIPEILANEGNPHALRSIGTLPVVMIMAVIPFSWIHDRFNKFGHSFKIFSISALAMIFLFIALFDPIKYFVFFANSPKQHESFNANLGEISKYIKILPQTTEKYIIAGGLERVPIKYLNPTMPNTFYLYDNELNLINPTQKNNFTVIFTSLNWDIINQVKARYPQLSFEKQENSFGDTFYILK